MVSVAFVGGNYDEQLRTNPEGLAGVRVVWSGGSVKAFRDIAATLRADVLVLTLEALGPEPVVVVSNLLTVTGAELAIVVYTYARRELIQSLVGEQVRVLQGPLTLAALRSQMLGLIVRGILAGKAPTGTAEALVGQTIVSCPRCGSRIPAERLRATPL